MKRDEMKAKLTMVYWKSRKFWLGKLVEHPEIMTQGRTLAELGARPISGAAAPQKPGTIVIAAGTVNDVRLYR